MTNNPMTNDISKVCDAVERLTKFYNETSSASVKHQGIADIQTILAELSRLESIAELNSSASEDSLPLALAPVSKEWYVLCERRYAVDRITISGDLARAIVDAVSSTRANEGEDMEPAAYIEPSELGKYHNGTGGPFLQAGVENAERSVPLYTHPMRELTDEEWGLLADAMLEVDGKMTDENIAKAAHEWLKGRK